MKEKLRDYFTFTRKERLGVIVLLIIILILFIIPYWIRRPPGTEDPEATRQFAPVMERLAQDSTAGNAGVEQGVSVQTGTRTAYRRNDKNPVKLFFFDPNVLGESDWQRRGLSERQSRTLVHYTGKGGRFRTAADLEKIYGLSAADRERLMPYVRIRSADGTGHHPGLLARRYRPARGSFPGDREFRSGYPAAGLPEIETDRRMARSGDARYYPVKYSGKKPAQIDINRSDSTQWKQLPGIGEKLAARIIRFREKLGGFYSVDQVGETFGLPDSTFRQIRSWLRSEAAEVRRIDLNTVSADSLKQHPYVRWKLAALLIRYREQHGRFRSVEDLNQIALIDPEALRKLGPYLEFSK